MLRSWDLHSYEFLVSCLQEFKVLEYLAMHIELSVGSWVWWTYEWWIYDVITSVEISEWMTYDINLNDHNIHALMNDITCE